MFVFKYIVRLSTRYHFFILKVGKAMSSNETAAYKIMRSLDVDYVLVIFGGVIGYSGDDINKFLWMVRIAEGEHPKDIRVRNLIIPPVWKSSQCPRNSFYLADCIVFVFIILSPKLVPYSDFTVFPRYKTFETHSFYFHPLYTAIPYQHSCFSSFTASPFCLSASIASTLVLTLRIVNRIEDSNPEIAIFALVLLPFPI